MEKIAALAPIPKASVRATAIQRAGTRARERMANLRSRRNGTCGVLLGTYGRGDLTMYVDINILEWMSRPNPVPFETTLRVRDCCLCLHVQRTARALARRFDQALRPVGLTNGQFSMLMSLNRPQPATMASV